MKETTIAHTASMEQHVDAIQAALDERGFNATQAVDELGHKAQEEWLPRNGARVVAKAWVDAAFRARLAWTARPGPAPRRICRRRSRQGRPMRRR